MRLNEEDKRAAGSEEELIREEAGDVRRLVYVSQIKPSGLERFLERMYAVSAHLHQRLASEGVRRCTVFRHDRKLFIYAECASDSRGFEWGSDFDGLLELWPQDERQADCCPMTDIFHYHDAGTFDKWRGDYVADRRIGLLARVKPDMVASYVYYHFLRQEEMPGSGNRTYMIGYYGSYLFSYQEHPVVIEKLPPRMRTKLVPDDWDAAMAPHFNDWSDTGEEQRIWRQLEQVFSF